MSSMKLFHTTPLTSTSTSSAVSAWGSIGRFKISPSILVRCIPSEPGKRTGKDQDPDFDFDKNKKKNLSKSSHFEDKNRRRGRPASKRSPDDSPLRDANRDYLYGILTIRAIRTLIVYLQETNLNLSHWLAQYLMQNPITLSGSWKDISGDAWLENLIRLPTQVSKYDVGKETLYDNAASIGVDPKDVCTRILEIRKTLAKEFIEDLTDVSEANADILRASLMTSLEASFKLDSSSEEE